jgi:recombinational DNA repair ATPase RecF
MRSASASSGVGVQVRIPRRYGDSLSAASRTVMELACEVSDAERTPDQERQLGEALQALLAAALGETMQQRVAAAVDVREWVDLEYEITRPGGKVQRWNSKTGLSGGERRLVVLAPMLAAIAAAYDRFGEKALRLVALDEVPAEVDERGREGLARYIAELDLDLVCTSYLWDGCPGAWDGIDAHDMEAGPDGTVVAFPMLVRGLAEIPEAMSPTPSPTERHS